MLSLRARRTLIWKRIKYHWPVAKIVSHFSISRETFYYHWNNYSKYGWDGLIIKSKAPHAVHKTADDIVKEIIALRKKFLWGPNKIENYFRSKGIHVSHGAIYNVLVDNNLNNPLDYTRKTWGKTRFQRMHPNTLWQADFKLLDDDTWMLTFLDDCSRFVTICKENIDATTENAILLLGKGIKNHGMPLQVLTDQGVQFFYAKDSPGEFTQFCIENNIQHIVASKRRPTTIGKVERWHRTYKEERYRFPTLRRYLHYYNFVRIHQSLNYLTPAEVFIGKKSVRDVVG